MRLMMRTRLGTVVSHQKWRSARTVTCQVAKCNTVAANQREKIVEVCKDFHLRGGFLELECTADVVSKLRKLQVQ